MSNTKPHENLYNALNQQGYDVGDLDQFTEKIKDAQKRRALFDAISAEFNVGDFDNFENSINYLWNNEDAHLATPSGSITSPFARTSDVTTPPLPEGIGEVSPRDGGVEDIQGDESTNKHAANLAQYTFKAPEQISATEVLQRNAETLANPTGLTKSTDPIQQAVSQDLINKAASQEWQRENLKHYQSEKERLQALYNQEIAKTSGRQFSSSFMGYNPSADTAMSRDASLYSLALQYLGDAEKQIIKAQKKSKASTPQQRNADDNFDLSQWQQSPSQYGYAPISIPGVKAPNKEQSQSPDPIQEAVAGVGDALFDIDTLTLGLDSLFKNATLQAILDKADADQPLTQAEEALLNAALYKQFTEAAYPDSRWYNVGKGIGSNIPYMLQFALSGGVAGALTKGAGKKIGKAVTKYINNLALKNGGKIANRTARKVFYNTARALGNGISNLSAGTLKALAQTPLQTSLYNDIIERQIGTLGYSPSASNSEIGGVAESRGGLQYTGRIDAESTGDAIRNSLASAFITNITEGVGGEGLQFIFNKIGGGALSGLGKGYTKLTGKQIQSPRLYNLFREAVSKRGLKPLLDAVGFNGAPAEFAEEILDQTLNAIFVGDSSLDPNSENYVFDLDNLIDTAITTGVISLFMGGMGAALSAKVHHDVNKAFAQANRNLEELKYSNIEIQALNDIAIDNPQNTAKWVSSITRTMRTLATSRADITNSLSPEARQYLDKENPTEDDKKALSLYDMQALTALGEITNRFNELTIQRDYVVAATNYNAMIQGLKERVVPQAEAELADIQANALRDSDYTINVKFKGQDAYLVSGTAEINDMPDGSTVATLPEGNIYQVRTKSPDGQWIIQQAIAEDIVPGTVTPTQQLIDAATARIYTPVQNLITAEQAQAQAEVAQSQPPVSTPNGPVEQTEQAQPSVETTPAGLNAPAAPNGPVEQATPIVEQATPSAEQREAITPPLPEGIGEVSRSDGGVNTQPTSATPSGLNAPEAPNGSTQSTEEQPLSDEQFDEHIATLPTGDAIQAITQRRGAEEADQYAQWRKGILTKERDKAHKTLNAKHKPFDPSRYTDYAQMKREERKHNDAIQATRNEALGIINRTTAEIADIDSYLANRNRQIAAEREAENPLRNGIAPAVAKLSINTLEQYIARYIALGGRLRMTDQYSNGLAAELGITPGSQEHRELLSILSNTEGMTPEQLAHDISENIEPEYRHLIAGRDVQEIRNAIIDTIASGVTSRRRAYQYIADANEKLSADEQRYIEEQELQAQIDADTEQAIRDYEELLLSLLTPDDLAIIDAMAGDYWDEISIQQYDQEAYNSLISPSAELGEDRESGADEGVVSNSQNIQTYDTNPTSTTPRITQQGAESTAIQSSTRPSNTTPIRQDSQDTATIRPETPQTSRNSSTRQDVVELQPINVGQFGPIYNQFRGKAQEAIAFLSQKQDGEAVAALNHPEIGDIDLVWGNAGTGKSDGYGLAKLVKYHPEVLNNLQEIINDMHVTQRSMNRVQLESDTHQAAVRLTWNDEKKNWLLTAFEKKNSASDNTTDTDETSTRGKQNDTATPQNTVSTHKDTTNSQTSNELNEKIVEAETEVNTNPTEAQKEAGNYKKGHIRIGSFDITIEQPQGSIRRGVDANGKAWESKMHNTYGYIRGTEGVDGDHIDVFLANDMDSWNGEQVFVVDQYNEDGTFDEHKVMLGFNDINDAETAYLSNYEKDWAQKHHIVTSATTTDAFNKWIDSSHRKTKAFAEYKTVKTTAGQATAAPDGSNGSNGPTTDSYTITPTQYTTKRGNVLNMQLVKFTNDLTKEQYRTAKELAKADKGWWDKSLGGFMMRSQESAQQLADTIASQPISMTDIKALNDGDIAFTEPQQSENKPHAPIWQYSIHVDTDGYTVLTREDVSSGNAVGDAHFSPAADSPEEMLEILRNPHNNMQEVLDAVGVILENKIQTRELDRKIAEQRKQEYEALRANGVNGYKINEIVIYKGKEAHIHDFEEFGDHRPVLDTGMAPVIYEVAEWSDIKKPQQNQSASSQTGQDLTTGYSIDNDAETSAKVVISNQGAKHELNNIIHKYAGQRKTRGFISDLARALGDRSNEPRQTYYFEFTDKQGNPYTLRISNHNVNGENIADNEKEISIVIKSRRQPNKFIAGNADVREYVYFKESIANGDGQTLAWIAQDIATMLDTGVYEDNSGIAILNTSPTNPTNQGQFGLVSDDRMAELKERLRRKLGGQMNIGIDPEILSIGLEIAVGHLDRGIKSFTNFARVMIADLGDTIRPYLKAFYNGARDLPEVIDNGLATDMTPYDEVQQFDVTNFDRTVPDLTAAATNTAREAEVANEVNVAKQRIKRSTEKKKSLPSSSNQLNLFDNTDNNNEDAREQDTRTNNRRTQPRREELPETESVEPRTPLQHTVEIGRRKRGNTRTSGNQLGNRPLYDVNKNYSNEEIGQIVSSVTDIVDGRVVITAPITDDIRAICHQYKSGGVAKKGHGILDEYYTDGKIVDAVSMLITPYFNNSNAIRVLEPSVGVGNFISAVDNIPTSEIVTFEINPTTARIAKILYPGIDVNLRSFETEFIDDAGNKKPLPQKYNLIVGNPPYGSHRGLYKGLGEESKIARYEDYFVKRSLDVLNEGGVLAMVLPSSWIDRHTQYGGYTIEAAYRLPSGAFEATQVGTDIVVLRKDSSIPTADHTPYFEQYPERVLGEVKQRKGRYGKMEDYVQGDIDTAIEAIKRDHAEQLANRLDITPSNDNLNNIEEAIDETGSLDKATAIVQTAKTEANSPAPSTTTGKKGKYKTVLNRGVETVPTSLQFSHQFSEGEVEAFYDTEYDGTINHPSQHRKYANYIGGRAMHDFYYAEGDIYAKLDQLESEKENIIATYGQEQYDKQKQLLMSVLPKRKGLSEITISPNTTFVKNLYIDTDKGSITLRDAFVDFCSKLPYQAFGDSSSWEVRGYVNNEQVYGQDKERNALVRERRKRVANDLFVKFLNEELSQSAQNQVVAAFNREYNSTYRPDYSRVPMFSTINKNFRGKPLKLTSVQLAGIGRMTVKGVGVLAHEVGFGKTLSGILAMHEAMTRGFATKPLVVVPNDNILKQWVETIKEVLPQATVNTLGNLGTSYDLTDFKVNDGEFTLVTYEGLKAMSFSDDTYNRLAERFSYITEDLKKHQSERDIQKEIEKKRELKGKMKRGAKTSYGFEDFGFDWLTVDEVHNCNHIVSKVRLDKSVSSDFRSQNQRTSDLGLKTWLAAQYIQEENNGRNVLLLSATPFTNKPLEYYSILSLVGNKMLKRKGFFHVDQFFSTFMEADNELEIGANGRPTQKTNVRRFRNNGLFQQLLSEFIDIKGEEDNPELVRPDRHNREYKINPNELTEDAMAAVQDLLNDNDTVLQGIGHARAAAFSPYATSLLGIRPKNHREFVKNSPKINTTIKLIEQNKKDRPDAGQIIYSEVGVEFFPLIRDYLVNESGFKPSEVRIITGATSNAERVNIQTAFNKGDVKVVIGSPAIKEGLNLQENTTDMYILSLPWNFTQLRQIEGRGWRQGNKWENIRINYMLTNNSVDVFMLQRLQLKQGLYNEAMKKGAETLDVSDIDTSELKTALITDPAVRAEIVTKQERKKLQQQRTQIEADLSFVLRKYESYNKLIEKLERKKKEIDLYRSYIKNGNSPAYWEDRIQREETQLQNIERDIEQEKENLLHKGVNVDDIVLQTEQSQKAIEGINQKIENLKEYQEELADKYRREQELKQQQQGDLIATYIKERKAENNNGSFYKIRPKDSQIRFRSINPDESLSDYARAVVANSQQTTTPATESLPENIKDRFSFRELDEQTFSAPASDSAIGEVPQGEGVKELSPSPEEQDIIDRAKANGTYLLAPNGQPTNLTPRQWAQVRTEAFKRWFGDWEKQARINKLRNSEPINIVFNNQYDLNRDSAKQWMKDNIRGEYTNKDSGETIKISRVGINEVTSHGTKDNAHLVSISAIPQLIENSIFIEEIPNEKENDKYDSYRYYVCGAKINGDDYTIKVVIGVKGDSKYYDHRLTQIEKGILIDNLNGLSNSVAENQNASYSMGKDSKLLSILQTNASKIIDSNGEPMVVRHNTNNEFTIFKDTYRGSASGDMGLYGAGYYFGNIGQTDLYGYHEMDEWLNLRNPKILPKDDIMTFFDYILDNFDEPALYDTVINDAFNKDRKTTLGTLINAIKDVKEADTKGEYDELIEQMKQYWGSEAHDMIVERKIFDKAGVVILRQLSNFINDNIGSENFTESLKNAGYDGVVEDWREYIAFSPNQIKSATDNIGTFDYRFNDIRFRSTDDMESAYEISDINGIHKVINLLEDKQTAHFFTSFDEYKQENVDNLNKWLKLHKDEFVRLYHGTNSRNNITEKGILKTTKTRRNSYQSESGYVYLSLYPSNARMFGEIASPYNGATVYSADIRIKDLKPDLDQLNNKRAANKDLENIGNTLADSLIYGNGARVKREIKPYEVNRTNFRSLSDAARQVAANDMPRRIEERTAQLAGKLGVTITVLHSNNDLRSRGEDFDILADWLDGNLDGRTHRMAGMFDAESNQLFVFAHNIAQTADPMALLEETITHEVVAHYGLRQLLGDNGLNTLLSGTWSAMPHDLQIRWGKYAMNHKRTDTLSAEEMTMLYSDARIQRKAAEEYIAHLSETGVTEPTLWQHICALFRRIMRKLGIFSYSPTEADIRYILSQSYRNLTNRGKSHNTQVTTPIGINTSFRSINPGESLTDYARAVVANSPKTRFRFIGEQGAANLDRAEEATTRLDNLAVAREMEQAGKNEHTIKHATGWERGADNLWRYEVPDVFNIQYPSVYTEFHRYIELNNKLYENSSQLTSDEMEELDKLSILFYGRQIPSITVRLQQLIDDYDLFDAYPLLINTTVNITDTKGEAYYSPISNQISIDSRFNKNEFEHILAHEIQHAIQGVEGFARGGNKNTAEKTYHRLAGEVEARNVQSRLNLTPEERAKTLAAETEDVAREDQIFIGNALGNPAMGSRGIKVPQSEYAKIAHAIATYPDKVERGHVFTDNYYYLCTNIDNEGNFTVVAQLQIEGNEELIRDIRQGLSMDPVIPIHGTESIAPFITQVKRRRGRTYRNISSSQRQTRVDGRNDNIHLGQQHNTASNQRPLDRDDDTIIPTTRLRSIAADNRTADYALDSIEQATADYADSLNAERGAIIDAITPKPDDSFRSINPDESLTDYARAVVANSPDTRFRALGTTRLNKYKVEKIFGGIWIKTKKEFAKFVSAVENYAFEEDGEGIAYTDNFLYAYYWNIDGQPIPYASVYLNREQSQDIVNQVNQEIKDGRKKEGIKQYFDRFVIRARSPKDENNANNGNNSSIPTSTNHDRLGSRLLRKGGYYNNPSLYVKTQRPDNSQQLTSTPTEDRPTLFRSIDDTRTADNALDTIEQATADYADSLNAEREAIIDAITPTPDDSLRTIAEKMRFREIGRELVTRDNTDLEKFTALPNKISNAMVYNDARHKHTAIAESQFDSMQRLHNLIDDLRKQGALIDERFDPWLTQNQSRSRAQAETNIFDLTYRPPLYDAIARGIRALFPDINTKDKADNAKGYSHLSLYAQARTAVERQAIKSAQARAEAEEKGEEYKERDFGGLAGIQEAIFGLYSAIDNDVEAAKGNIEKLTALAIERGIPTVQEYIDNAEAKLGNPDNNGTAAHQLCTAIRSISAYQLTYSYNAGLTSRAGYQTLTYGRNIDGLLRERYNMQAKQIKDNPGSYDNVTDYDKDGNATATRMVLNDNARIALNKLNKEYAAAIDNVPMPGKNGSWQQLIDTGWLTEEDVNSLHRYYMYYMPLKGHAELTAEDIAEYEHKTPRNISKIKAVEGHSHLAKDPFNQLILDTHGAIQNAEQNRWRTHLYNILTNNPNPSQYVVEQRFYKIETKSDGSKEYVPYGTVETINGVEVFIPGRPTAEELANGTAVSYNNRFTRAEVDIPINNDQLKEHSVTVIVDGEAYTIFFYDKRIADAINGTNIKRPSDWLKYLDKLQALNRLYAGFKTSLNPTFTLISNLPRDWMEMVSNNLIEHGVAHAVASLIYRVRATRVGDVQAALRKHQEGKLLTMADATTDVERYVVEFFNNGGSVNITQLPDYNTAKVELMDDLNTFMRTGQMPKGSAWARGFNNMAERVELAPRLATYIASRTLGRNISQSINDAKEATVNFDRKGSWSGIMGMFQLFYNAAAQSVRRQISLARRHPLRFFATYATIGLTSPLGSIIASYISSLLLGDDDDIDDICRKYFAINPELRRRYFIILIGDDYIRIPMAVNYLPYVTLGDVLANWRYNPNYRSNPLKDTLDIASAILDTFLPSMIAQPIGFFFDTITAKNEQDKINAWIALGGSIATTAAGFFAGRFVEPLGQSLANYNFMGGTLFDRPFDKNSQEPAYLRARQYTQPVWVWASHLLNDITGGNEVHAGLLNIAPEQIENVMTVFGGYGEYGENIISLGIETVSILSGENTDAEVFKKSFPLLSRLYGGNTAERYDKSMQSMFYDDTTALAQYNEYRKHATTASTRADFDRTYSPDEQRYFADLNTMQTIAKRIREDVKAATPEGEAPKYHADERLKAIYNLANEQFHSLASGEYKPVDDPYYTYMYIKDAIEKAPHRTTDGTYRLINTSERSADRRGHLNQLLQSFSETRSKHKALPSGYYPGMPLDNREEQALNQFNIAVGKLIEAYKNADLDNLTPTDNAQ